MGKNKMYKIENKKQRKQVILEVDLNREDEDLLKKKLNLLALSQKLSNEQTELLETIFGYDWYKTCEINIVK